MKAGINTRKGISSGPVVEDVSDSFAYSAMSVSRVCFSMNCLSGSAPFLHGLLHGDFVLGERQCRRLDRFVKTWAHHEKGEKQR